MVGRLTSCLSNMTYWINSSHLPYSKTFQSPAFHAVVPNMNSVYGSSIDPPLRGVYTFTFTFTFILFPSDGVVVHSTVAMSEHHPHQ